MGGEQGCDIEHLGEGADPYDARLAEERSTVTSEVAKRAPVCDCVALKPAAERPLLTASMGFFLATRLVMRANFLGFPNDSR